MAYLRRHPRSAFECPLILGVPPGPGIPGEACDLGLSGMGVIVGTRVPRGTEVTILLDPDSAPDELAHMRRLVGSIAYSRSEGYTAAGGQDFRLGIRFHSLNQDMRHRLHTVIGDLVTRRSTHGRGDLPLTEEGRELLYQTAYEHLERRRWALAREIAVSAVRADRQNPTFRAFIHRVNAEEALATDRRDAARREAAAALKLQPDDPEVIELADRAGCNVEPPGVIQRLFSRLKTQREG